MLKEIIYGAGVLFILTYAIFSPIETPEPVIADVHENRPIIIEAKPLVVEEPVEEVIEFIDIYEELEEPIEELPLTDEEIDLIAIITMAEAEGEPEEGQRLVIDTILNRVDSRDFPDTVNEVIYQPSQFSSVWNGRADRCYVIDDIRQLVLEELETRTDSEVIFFRTERYSSFGTPMFQVENHYFSKS